MSCSDWADKVPRGEITSFWVNKQPASSTAVPQIGFSRPRGQGSALARHPAHGNIVLRLFVLVQIRARRSRGKVPLQLQNNDVSASSWS